MVAAVINAQHQFAEAEGDSQPLTIHGDMFGTAFDEGCKAFSRGYQRVAVFNGKSEVVCQVKYLEQENGTDSSYGLVFRRDLSPSSGQVEYTLRLHPTWGPVLTFTLQGLPPEESVSDVETAYKFLVSADEGAFLRTAGVAGCNGVIRWTDEFGCRSPCFMVDPCGLHDLAHEFKWHLATVNLESLVAWISTYGRPVGLKLPLSVVSAMLH